MCVRFPLFALLDHAVSSLKVGRRQGARDERGQMSLVRRGDEAQRKDERGEDEMEVQVLRRERHGPRRQLRQEA